MMLPIVMIFAALAAWAAWFYILIRLDPFVGTWIAHLLFYAATALALFGTFLSAGSLVYRWHYGKPAAPRQIGRISRQALLFILFILAIMLLSSRNLLRWWNMFLLVMLTFSIEIFLITYSRTEYRPAKKP